MRCFSPQRADMWLVCTCECVCITYTTHKHTHVYLSQPQLAMFSSRVKPAGSNKTSAGPNGREDSSLICYYRDHWPWHISQNTIRKCSTLDLWVFLFNTHKNTLHVQCTTTHMQTSCMIHRIWRQSLYVRTYIHMYVHTAYKDSL